MPERNDQGVFQNEAGLTESEATNYLTYLFRDYGEQPIEPSRLQAALDLVKTPNAALVSRAQLLGAITSAAALPVPDKATQPFADVPADGELARTSQPWIDRKWIAADRADRFEPDRAMPFAEFKQLTFHALFSSLLKTPPAAVSYRRRLVHDTFHRANEPIAQLASGEKPIDSAAWRVESGQLRPVERMGTTYLLVDAGVPDVDVSADVFLEQTKNEAAAGLVFQARDAGNMQRFLVQAKGPALEVRIDSIVDGQELKRLERPYSPQSTLVGLLNGGDEASRFDNLEVREVAGE